MDHDNRRRLEHARGDDVWRADVHSEPIEQQLRESTMLQFNIDRQSEVALQGHVVFTEIAVFR